MDVYMAIIKSAFSLLDGLMVQADTAVERSSAAMK